jgi:hypothetical protein
MKSEIRSIELLSTPVVQPHDRLVCSPHGGGLTGCHDDLVALVVLKDAGSDHIEWTVCERWLVTHPDALAHQAL